MSGGLDYVAERMRKMIANRRVSHMQRMAKGLAQEEYLKLCGAYAELEHLAAELDQSIKKANASADLDEVEDENTLKLKTLLSEERP